MDKQEKKAVIKKITKIKKIKQNLKIKNLKPKEKNR